MLLHALCVAMMVVMHIPVGIDMMRTYDELEHALSNYQHWLRDVRLKGSVEPELSKHLDAIGEAVDSCIKNHEVSSADEALDLQKSLELTQSVVLSPGMSNSKELSNLGEKILNKSLEKVKKEHWKTLGLELIELSISVLLFINVFTPVTMPVAATIGLHLAESVAEALSSHFRRGEKMTVDSHQSLKENIDSIVQVSRFTP